MNLFGALPTLLSAPFTFMIFVYSADFAQHGLSSARAFTTLTLLGLLTSPLEKILKSIPIFTATFGCFDRIQAYLLLEIQTHAEILLSEERRRPTISSTSSTSDVTVLRIEAEKADRPPSCAVVLDNVTVRYGSGDSAAVLTDFSLSLDHGQVVMVVGPVGCGKSTLLKTILGDLVIARGALWRNEIEAAYCQQTPWLTNGTVRDNIVGQSLHHDDDDAWYGTVKSACGLDEDISGWPDADDTKIGSAGIVCSGGQKQRLVSTTSVRPRPCRRNCLADSNCSRHRHWRELYMRGKGWWFSMMCSAPSTPGQGNIVSTRCCPGKDFCGDWEPQ